MENYITKKRLEELIDYYSQSSNLQRYYKISDYVELLKNEINKLKVLMKEDEHGITKDFVLKHQNALNEALKISNEEFAIFLDDHGEVYNYDLISLIDDSEYRQV